MKLWPGSLAWRTLAVLVVALVASQAAALWLLREHVERPRIGMGIGQFVSHLKTISAALETLPPEQQREFIARLAEREGIRIFPTRGEGPLRPAPSIPAIQMFRERIKALFGPETEVFVRPNAPLALWVWLPAGQHEFWVAFPRNRVDRDPSGAFLWWSVAGIAIAILATLLIVWRLNRPLRQLAHAAEKLGKGGDPDPVPETGPTEIRAVAHAFNQMKEDLRRGEKERAAFLAGISHDLRTPLARLRLDVEMLGDRVEAETQKGMVSDIEDMNAIIDQFIDFMRSEATEPLSAVDLSELARGAAERAARAGTAVKCELAEVPVLMLRPLALRRLVDNLVGNAAKHAGGEVLVRTAATGREVSLSVLDRGPGIAAADIERLKQPFTRLDEARSGSSGAGLGLAIAARIAAMHGGRLDFASREGGGLEARLVLPVSA